jgi:hypothetical protein
MKYLLTCTLLRTNSPTCAYFHLLHHTHRQGGGLHSLLKISTYIPSGSTKEKRIGVPFAPSQSVTISAQASSTLSPFATAPAAVDSAKESGSNVSILFCSLVLFFL